jgi:hypothetical protein
LKLWTDERLDDRLGEFDKALKSVQYDLRTFGPVLGQVALLESKVSDARDELKELRKEIKEDRASSRGEAVRVIFVVVGVFAMITGGSVVAVLTGLVG